MTNGDATVRLLVRANAARAAAKGFQFLGWLVIAVSVILTFVVVGELSDRGGGFLDSAEAVDTATKLLAVAQVGLVGAVPGLMLVALGSVLKLLADWAEASLPPDMPVAEQGDPEGYAGASVLPTSPGG